MKVTDEDLDRLKAIVEGDYVAPPKDAFDLSADALFGGITGFPLPFQIFEVLPGLTLARTYAHLFAPYMLAFSPPPKPTAPHPGPWSALTIQALTILVEAKLDAGCQPLGFDRMNTLWFLTAMLRLRLALPIQMLAVTDRPFQKVRENPETANLLPVELNLSHLLTAPPRLPTEADLLWVRDNILQGAQLMRQPEFNRAMATLDQAISIQSPGAGIVIAWAAVETLIRPGSKQITDRLCRALAVHLHPPGVDRDRAFGVIAASYAARGGAVHAGDQPEAEEFHAAFRLARAAMIRCIEDGRLPDIDTLLDRWNTKT